MFSPGQACVASDASSFCCVPGFRCSASSSGGGGGGGGGGNDAQVGACEPVPASELTYAFAAARGAVAGAADAFEAGRALEAALTSGGGASSADGRCASRDSSSAAAAAATPLAAAWCVERRLLPGDACDPSASPAVECCPDGYSCAEDGGGGGGGDASSNNSNASFRCRVAVTASALSAATEPLAPAAAASPALRAAVATTAARAAAAAAQQGSCTDDAAATTTTTTAAAEEASLRAGAAATLRPAAAASAAAALPFPPPELPADACSCRVDAQGRRVPAPCPSAWDLSPPSASSPPPALRVNTKTGVLETDPPAAGGTPPLARLRGVNWFGWETGQKNLDGLWAYCDDAGDPSSAACPPGAQIPPASAVAQGDRDAMKAYWWGKRTSTNDFASVVHAIKLLGFNAVRVPFTFAELAAPLPANGDGSGRAPGEFALCLRDDLDALAFSRLADPALDPAALRRSAGGGAASSFPRYAGAPHPPPPEFWPAGPSARAQCDLPWEAPLAGGVSDPSRGDRTLRLTTCNWYLPQAPGTAAIHRFLFQVEYLVSQGLYVVLSYHPTAPRDAATADARLFAANWGNLWRALAARPAYAAKLRGRVLPDLLNEGSRYGCMYEREAVVASGDGAGAPACAPMAAALSAATAALQAADRLLPGVLVNGLGQSGTPADVAPGGNADCVGAGTCFRGMPWGDGFVTRRSVFASGAPRASNPSSLFAAPSSSSSSSSTPPATPLASILALSPHAYPVSITGWDLYTQQNPSLSQRFNASFGLKAAGRDALYSGRRLPRRPPVLLGEVGVRDDADNGVGAPNADTTRWRQEDLAWLADVRRYFASSFLRVRALPASSSSSSPPPGRRPVAAASASRGRPASSYPLSWFFWSWNANSGDTKGLVGPATTWRVIQWTKVRALVSELGLRPWYCDFAPAEACRMSTA
jgi:hypothetical protein